MEGKEVASTNVRRILPSPVSRTLVGSLKFHNPITLDTEFVMNCFHARSFNQTEALVNFWVIEKAVMTLIVIFLFLLDDYDLLDGELA